METRLLNPTRSGSGIGPRHPNLPLRLQLRRIPASHGLRPGAV